MDIELTTPDIDRIIEMAWEDRTSFDAIAFQFGLSQQQVITLMRQQMKLSSFKMWRKRTSGNRNKHTALRNAHISRFRCSRQKTIAMNKISKR